MDARGWYTFNTHLLTYSTYDVETGEEVTVEAPFSVVEKVWNAAKADLAPYEARIKQLENLVEAQAKALKLV